MRYLIVSHHGIGDVVHAIPLIKAIKTNDSSAYIALLVHSSDRVSVLQGQELIDDYFCFENARVNVVALIKLILKIRKSRFDYGVISSCAMNIGLISKLLRIMGCKIIISNNTQISTSGVQVEHR